MFEAHGTHHIDINDRILRIDAYDAWNEQQSRDFVTLLRTEIDANLRGQSWAVLVVMHAWLPTTDSLTLLRDITEYAIAAGMRYEAFTGDSALSANVLSNRILPPDSDVYTKAQFDTEQEAINWLRSNLTSLS